MLQDLAQFVASGLTRGAIYALVGAGFAIIYSASNVINFAQGEFVMLGGMVTAFLTVTTGLLPLWLAIPAAILLTVLVGVALYRFAVAKVDPSQIATIIIITIGTSILIRGVVEVVLGKREFVYPAFTPAGPVRLLGAALDVQSLWVLGALVVVAAGLKLFFDHTLYGKAMRAAAQSPVAAQLVGIDVRNVLVTSFALSAALGALAGAFVTPITLTRFDVGLMLGLKGFAATMLGGLGSRYGALAGLLLGLVEALAGGHISSGYQDAVASCSFLWRVHRLRCSEDRHRRRRARRHRRQEADAGSHPRRDREDQGLRGPQRHREHDASGSHGAGQLRVHHCGREERRLAAGGKAEPRPLGRRRVEAAATGRARDPAQAQAHAPCRAVQSTKNWTAGTNRAMTPRKMVQQRWSRRRVWSTVAAGEMGMMNSLAVSRAASVDSTFIGRALALVILAGALSGCLFTNRSTTAPAPDAHLASASAVDKIPCPSHDFPAFLDAFGESVEVQRGYTRIPLEYGQLDAGSHGKPKQEKTFTTRTINAFDAIPVSDAKDGGRILRSKVKRREKGLRIKVEPDSEASPDTKTVTILLPGTGFHLEYHFVSTDSCWELVRIDDRST